MSPDTSPLVYLSLVASKKGHAMLREDPLVAALDLHPQPDNPRLLIALGEVCGSSRPISPQRLTRLGPLLILWLDQQEWLVLPCADGADDSSNLDAVLYQSFGDSLSLVPIPDGTFQAELSEQAWQTLNNYQSWPLNGSNINTPAVNATALHSICIRTWSSQTAYDLLLTRADQARLEACLPSRQH